MFNLIYTICVVFLHYKYILLYNTFFHCPTLSDVEHKTLYVNNNGRGRASTDAITEVSDFTDILRDNGRTWLLPAHASSEHVSKSL